ncbi:MAG: winged helix-turn-helix transcriptional regulator [Thermoleophilia bacterium]|nr:winged helix-turn-helix transcriptional regulator [Thermoleophilia bacterium]
MSDAGFSEEEVRAGTRVLSLFVSPLTARVLRAHVDGPKRLADIQGAVGMAAESTVRATVSNLCEVGALAKEAVGNSSQAVETRLTEAGKEMVFVADVIDTWLSQAPNGPIPPDSEGAKTAVKALAGGWSSTLMRALASHPFTLTELSALIPSVTYPTLERRISWMKMTGQIEPAEREGRGTPYVVTEWLRHAIAPLCAAGRCERRHLMAESPPITHVEVETCFMLVAPIAPLPDHVDGSCMLAAQTDSEGPEGVRGLAGVAVEFEQGQVRSCVPEVSATPATWAVGTPEAWFDAVIDGRIDNLRIGGERPQLALDLASGLHQALFADR